MSLITYLPLIGIPIIIFGFALRFNPLLVVTSAGLATGLAVGIDAAKLLEIFGEKFFNSRQLTSTLLIIPVIGLLEKYGLRTRAQSWVAGFRAATTSRILMLYFVVRQISATLGLLSLGGHAQTVRPLLAPMAEGAANKDHGDLPPELKDRIAAHAAACENVALFFGEDVFIAFGAVLLMSSFLKENGIIGIEPVHIGLWGLPTAFCALLIHLFRLSRLDARIAREIIAWRAAQAAIAKALQKEKNA